MPARRLNRGQAVSIHVFDVCGQDSSDKPEFVRHVGLSAEERTSAGADQSAVPLVHMGPPLRRDGHESLVQTVGSAGLTSDQVQQVRLFVDELESEYEAQRIRGDKRKQYVIHPHVREPDEGVACRRFNCAGFVIEAYRDAGIVLLTGESDQVPAITLETIARAYPDFAPLLGRPRFRSELGLEGDGPWRVVLAGYVMNSLNREATALRVEPYVPQSGDEFFPSRAPTTSP